METEASYFKEVTWQRSHSYSQANQKLQQQTYLLPVQRYFHYNKLTMWRKGFQDFNPILGSVTIAVTLYNPWTFGENEVS